MKTLTLLMMASWFASSATHAVVTEWDLSETTLGGEKRADELLRTMHKKFTEEGYVMRLNLRGQRAVDTKFLEQFVDSGFAERLVTADLSGTNVDRNALEVLLKSKKAGTWRDLPQYSARYETPFSTILLDVTDTRVSDIDIEMVSRELAVGLTFQYGSDEKSITPLPSRGIFEGFFEKASLQIPDHLDGGIKQLVFKERGAPRPAKPIAYLSTGVTHGVYTLAHNFFAQRSRSKDRAPSLQDLPKNVGKPPSLTMGS